MAIKDRTVTTSNIRGYLANLVATSNIHDLHSWWSAPGTCTGGVVSMLTGSITDVHKHMDTMYKRFVNTQLESGDWRKRTKTNMWPTL